MATTFHPFPRLPSEIRMHIWALSVYGRHVHIRITPKSEAPGNRDYNYVSMIPQAEPMQVYRESRQFAPYRKAFLTTLPGDCEARYIWVNFDEDMICLQDEKMERLTPHDADIQRLRFTVPTGDNEYWAEVFRRFTNNYFKQFTALREVHLAISECFAFWGQMSGGPGFGKCPRENVRYLDVHTGLMLTLPQLWMLGEWGDRKGGLVQDMGDFDEDLRWTCDNYDFFIADCAEVE
ncbi:hypothetical protein V8C42DRAFT_259584 [Trichoderma barbatum]